MRIFSSFLAASASTAATVTAVSASARGERMFNHKAVPLLTASAPFAGPVGAGALVVAGGLVLARRYRLAAVTATAGVASLIAAGGRPLPSLPADFQGKLAVDDVRIFFHNVLMTNGSGSESIAQEIVSSNPDIVALVETSRTSFKDIEPAIERYPYRWNWRIGEELEFDGAAVASKHPILDVRVMEDAGRPAAEFLIDVYGKKMRFVVVHTNAPVKPSWAVPWVQQMQELTRHAENTREDYLVYVGDFNATIAHAPFRSFVRRSGLRDVTRSVPTWPKHRFAPKVLGLDHILIRGPIEVKRVRLGEGEGSDHTPIVLDMRLGEVRREIEPAALKLSI